MKRAFATLELRVLKKNTKQKKKKKKQFISENVHQEKLQHNLQSYSLSSRLGWVLLSVFFILVTSHPNGDSNLKVLVYAAIGIFIFFKCPPSVPGRAGVAPCRVSFG